MKALNLKKIATTLMVATTISFSAVVKADDVLVVPVISKPAALQEGTQRELTVAQIAELLPWAKDSKMFLIDLLENVQTLSASDKVERLVEGIKSVVGESAPKNSEMLMRYALNRGLVINDILNKETNQDAVGTVDVKLRVLKASINMAIKYYDSDVEVVQNKTKLAFADFGLSYYAFLAELNKSVFDASAQYVIQRTALEFLQWDLYRDLENTTFAASIVKINNGLKVFPVKAKSDAQAINIIRQMKSLSSQIAKNKVANTASIVSSKQFETLMVKKQLAKTIDEAIQNAAEGMRYARSVEDFFRAVSPEITNPNDNYKKALEKLAYDYRSLLINDLNGSASDVFKLVEMLNNLDQIEVVTREFLPKIKTAEDFLIVFSYSVNTPSPAYKDLLTKMTGEHYSTFMDLNPTEAQKQALMAKLK